MKVRGLAAARRSRVVRMPVRALRRLRDSASTANQGRVIVRSGVFDVDWFTAQCGEHFSSEGAAIERYLRSPRRMAYSPHPLFEAPAFDPQWSTRVVDPFVAFLRSSQQHTRTSPHPMFDPDVADHQLEGSPAATALRDEVGTWVAWARTATAKSPVPSAAPGPVVTWGEVRARALAAADEWRRRAEHLERLRRATAVSQVIAPTHEPIGPADSDAPRVSVVIATWNRARSLRAAIASIQMQSLDDLEVIVIDDGSDDDTPSVVAGLSYFDARIRYLRQDRAGVCRARNLGLQAARGAYVAFLDSDNTWKPDFLSTMVATMQAEGWAVAHAPLEVRNKGVISYRAAEGVRESLLLGNYIDLNVLVARRQLLLDVGGFDESLRRAVDYDLILRLSAVSDIHLVHVVGAVYREDENDHSRISSREPATWNQAVRGRHTIDWMEVGGRPRKTGRVSVIVPVARRLDVMLSLIDLIHPNAADQTPQLDVELVLVGTSSRTDYCCLTACLTGRPGKVILHNPNDKLALLTNVGAAASTGEILVLLRPNGTLNKDALAPLITALADPCVGIAQPIVEKANMTVASAGGLFGPKGMSPYPFLEGFPVSDALRLGDCDLPAALSPAVAIRASDFIDVEGMDPLFGNSLGDADLSLRVRERGLGATRLVTAARVTARSQRAAGFPHDMAQSARLMSERWRTVPPGSEDLWRRAGFAAGTYRPVELTGTVQQHERCFALRPEPRRTALRVVDGLPTLRWTIDIAAPAGKRGAWWGDRHFANALARSLSRRGQHVAVDHREARQRPTRIHDDVLLVLRGLDEVHPPPGPTNLLWILSHPDTVSPSEVARYDAAFAASSSWASDRSAQWGLTIRPLLQCTDPALFHPDRAPVDSGPAMLFVGNTRNAVRPIVRFALDAVGAGELAVFGRGWDGILDARCLQGDLVPNDELGALYAGAGFVLNDHWSDMRAAGFLSNRLFDAVASGSRVISDDVPGVAEIFGMSVAIVHDPEDLARIVRAPYRRHFPDQDERVEQARRIHRAHSFDIRADLLIEQVLRLRSRRDDIGLRRRDVGETIHRW